MLYGRIIKQGTINDSAARGLAMIPFDWRVSSFVESVYRPEIDAYKGAALESSSQSRRQHRMH